MHQLTGTDIEEKKLRSCYQNGIVPTRFRWLHEEAFLHLPENLTISDMYRSPLGSLEAVRAKRGAQWPGYSGHNFGLSVDLDVNDTLTRVGFKTKRHLDGYMQTAGWYCHRLDGSRGFEDWHYNFLGENAPKGTRSSDELEYLVGALYKDHWEQLKDPTVRQGALHVLGFYDGELDGKFGSRSQAGEAAFKRAWAYKPGIDYLRVLWVCAEARVENRW